MIDFTLKVYKKLLNILIANNYAFSSFEHFLQNSHKKVIVLRHDIDKKILNALKFAQLEYSMNVTASYYFRITHGSFDSKIINQVSDLGHEIGYHYEDIALAYKIIKNKKHKINKEEFKKLLFERAIDSFEKNLK